MEIQERKRSELYLQRDDIKLPQAHLESLHHPSPKYSKSPGLVDGIDRIQQVVVVSIKIN